MLSTDIQPIVFAGGRGSRMTHMIGTTVPKCLLRICGQPLIYYPLKTLANYGFQEVSVIIQEREDVEQAVGKLGALLGLRIDFHTIQEDDEDFGTLESLRSFIKANKVNKQKRDVLLMSCDTIMDARLNSLVNFHKGHSSSATALFLKNFTPALPAGTKLPGPKNKVKLERDIVGLRPGNNQLIFMASEADFDEELAVPLDVLQASPNTKIFTSFMDTHVYLFRREVLERRVQDSATEELLSIKGEFLPHLIQEQIKNFDPSFVPDLLVRPNESRITLFAVLQPESRVIRVNTVPAYSSACKSGEWIKQNFSDTGGRSGATIAKSAKVAGSQLAEQCTVGEKAKVVNVVAMDNVTFEDGCTVENSIISPNAIIGTKAVVKECLVGPGYQVPEGGRFVNEFLTIMEDALMFED